MCQYPLQMNGNGHGNENRITKDLIMYIIILPMVIMLLLLIKLVICHLPILTRWSRGSC